MWADDPVYTLSFTKLTSGTNYNSYTGSHSITCSTIGWSVYGNQSLGDYIRVGGKNTTNTDRTLTSSAVLSSTKKIGKVTINHSGTGNGKDSEITINSITVEGSTSSDFSSSISKTISSPSVASSGSLDFVPDEDWATSSYFKITVNYKITGSNNCYLTINSVDFYEAIGGGSLTTSDLALTGAPIDLDFDLYNNSSNQVINYTTSSTGAVTVSSSSYISTSVDSENKRITITPTAVTPSAQTITVSQAADATYAAGSATFTVTVANSAPVINASNVNIEATATSGTISYSITNPEGGASLTASETEDWISNVAVDSENSRVTFTTTTNTAYIQRTGTITLTYGDDLATKDITVNQSSATPPGSKHEWDLSTNSYSTASSAAVTWTSTYATMTNSKGSGNDANNYLPTTNTSSRFYKDNNLTITPSSGYKINGVVFTATTAGYASTLGSSTWTNATAYVSNTKVTIIPTNGNNSISATIGGTCGFTKVEVYYELLPIPSIAVASTSIATTAAGTGGTISITYNNITDVMAEVQFFEADGTTPATYGWIDAEINGDNDVEYLIDANDGAARTAYMKVYALDDELNDVYSPLITITQAGIDYATLPFNWAGGTSSGLTALTGVTANGLGTDYAVDNAPYRVKMDNANDYIQIKTNAQPGKVSVGIKMLGGATTSKIKVQESSNGTDFTDVQELTVSGELNDIVNLVTTNSFATTSRYVRIIKSVHASGGNIGVGPISIAESGEPALPLVSGTTVTLTTTSNMAGWRTYDNNTSKKYTVDGTTKVFYVSETGENKVTLTEIDGGVPANTVVILHQTSGTTITLTETNNVITAPVSNLLQVSEANDNLGTVYRLGYKASHGVGFYTYTSASAPAGIIYIDTVNSARDFLGFDFGEENVTAIESIKAQKLDGQYFNLAGQRVAQPTKGLCIVNGKKFLIK